MALAAALILTGWAKGGPSYVKGVQKPCIQHVQLS
jgi:hypothetical protein